MAKTIFTITFDLSDPNRTLEQQRADEISRLKQNYRNRIYKAKRQYEDEYTKPNGDPAKIAKYKANWDKLENERVNIGAQIDAAVEAEYQKALAGNYVAPQKTPSRAKRAPAPGKVPPAPATPASKPTVKATIKAPKAKAPAAAPTPVPVAPAPVAPVAVTPPLLAGTSPMIQAANTMFAPLVAQTQSMIATTSTQLAPNNKPSLLTVTSSPSQRVFGLHTTDEIQAQLAPRLKALPPEQRARFETEFNNLLGARDARLQAGKSTGKIDAQIRALSNRMYARYEKTAQTKSRAQKKFRIGALDRKRMYATGRLGLVDRNGLFGVAEQLVNAFGGADIGKLRSLIQAQAAAINRGDTRSVAPIQSIIKQMYAREKALGISKQLLRVRGSGSADPWKFLTHDEGLQLGLSTLSDLLQGGFIDQKNWAARTNEMQKAYSQAIGGIDKEPLQTGVRNALADKHRMEATKFRNQRTQYRQTHQQLFAQTAMRSFLGVQRGIDWTQDSQIEAAIGDLEAIAKILPGGTQYKETFEALRFQNANASGMERKKLYDNLVRASNDIEQQARRNPNAYRIYGDRIRATPDKALASEVMDQAAMLNAARINNYHYQQKAFKQGFGRFLGGIAPLANRELYDDSGYLVGREFGWNWRRGSGAVTRMKEGSLSMLNAFKMMWKENFPELAKSISGAILQGFMLSARMLLPVAMVGGGVAAAGSIAAARYGISSANRRQSLQTMYDVSIPNSWKHGMSYDEFERENFSVARDMRTNAYALQENALRLATAVNTARYSTGARAGQPIVTDFQDVMRMSRNMAILARISGVSDSDLAAFMLQIQQGIGKGKLDTMDIKPMENRSTMMATLWAQKFLGLSGAAEMFRMMDEGRGDRTKGITPEKFLPRMASKEVEKELMEMLRSTARTWDQVFTVVGSDLQEGMLNFTKKFQDAANGRLGSQVLGVSKYVAEEKLSDTGTLGDILNKLLPDLNDLPALINSGMHNLGKLFKLSGDITRVFTELLPAVSAIGATFLGVASILEGVTGIFAGIFVFLGVLSKGLFTPGVSIKDSFRLAWNAFVGSFDASVTSRKAANSLMRTTTKLLDPLKGLAEFEGAVGDELIAANVGLKDVGEGGKGKPMNVEDSGLTGTTAEIAKDTKEIKKNGAKLTSIQLELLKQVSGRAVINNMTRVAPNIVANVGTIKSGVEYEQFMADLNKTVRLASMNMAY